MATKQSSVTPLDRVGLTLCFAIMVHGIIVLGVTFAPEDESYQRFETMEIVLVQEQSEAPEEARALAQASLRGGGDTIAEQQPTTPSPSLSPRQDEEIAVSYIDETQIPVEEITDPPEPVEVEPDIEPAEVPEKIALESDESNLRLPNKSDEQSENVKSVEQVVDQEIPDKNADDQNLPETPLLPPTPDAMSLMVNRLEMESLSAAIENKLRARSSRVRKKFISASTKESKYALYMKLWSKKVERVGNLNYPEVAREKKLSGNLRLDVAINKDGSVNNITVTKSSGHQVLDNAAIRIVKFAAPYEPFPDEISEEVDVLHIVRTWRFSDSSRFK